MYILLGKVHVCFQTKSMGCFFNERNLKPQKELKGLNEYLKTNVINEIDLA